MRISIAVGDRIEGVPEIQWFAICLLSHSPTGDLNR